jgi:hypothetical protein
MFTHNYSLFSIAVATYHQMDNGPIFRLTHYLVIALLLAMYTTLPIAAQEEVTIYGLNQFEAIAEIDLLTGTVTAVGTLAFGTQAADQDPDTEYVYYVERLTSGRRFAYWDPATQQNTLVYTHPQRFNFYAKRLAFAPDGALYMMDAEDNLYTIEKTTGVITLLGPVSGLVNGSHGGTGDIVFTNDGTLYVNTYQNFYTVDIVTREASIVFEDMLGPGDRVWTGLAYCNNVFYGTAAFFDTLTMSFYRIEPDSGAMTELYTSPHVTHTFNDLTTCPPHSPTAIRLSGGQAAHRDQPPLWAFLILAVGTAALLRRSSTFRKG